MRDKKRTDQPDRTSSQNTGRTTPTHSQRKESGSGSENRLNRSIFLDRPAKNPSTYRRQRGGL